MDCCSIMLVTYNRLELTKRTLDNLFANAKYPFRLIIVDNGSTDGSKEWLKELEKNIPQESGCIAYEPHFNETNLGIARGRNIGLHLADKHEDRWMATMDNDIEAPEGWLAECIDIMKANSNFVIGVNMEQRPYPLKTLGANTFQVKPMGNLGTACMVFPRTLHDKIGHFNEDYAMYAHEDADFGFRTRMAKFQLGYIKQLGNHFGIGDLDQGEYRIFKDAHVKANLPRYMINCHKYRSGQKPIYIPYNKEAQ